MKIWQRVAVVLVAVIVGRGAHAQASPEAAQARRAKPAAATAPAASACPKDFDLSAATIRAIQIDNADIFDLSDPREDIWPYRLANRLHIRTRPRIIEHQLLFHAGERYDQRVIDETARILRNNDYFYDAKIVPVNCADGKVDVRVTTRDVWTLNPGVSFGRKGGRNTSGFELEELNLLGTGTAINLARKNGVDRSSTSITFSDPHLRGSWAALKLGYSDNSDGKSKSASLRRPFYALDTTWAAGVSAGDEDSVVSLYDLNKKKDEFSKRNRFAKIDAAWSRGLVNGWVQRFGTGMVYDESDFSSAPDPTKTNLLPANRKFVYPLLSYELLQDEYRTLRNYDRIGRTEDFLYGSHLTAQLGFATKTLGSSRDALIYSTSLSKGYELNERDSLLLSAGVSGRAASGGSENVVLSADARYYWRQSAKRLFFTSLHADLGSKLDVDNQILLGGDNGLRGYPLRYQAGEKSVLFSVEQRYYTDYYPFRLFRVGGAIFADVGKVWGDNAFNTASRGVLKDVGFGLRLGNTRSGLGNVIHIDVAFPLDRDSTIKNVQFLVETKRSF